MRPLEICWSAVPDSGQIASSPAGKMRGIGAAKIARTFSLDRADALYPSTPRCPARDLGRRRPPKWLCCSPTAPKIQERSRSCPNLRRRARPIALWPVNQAGPRGKLVARMAASIVRSWPTDLAPHSPARRAMRLGTPVAAGLDGSGRGISPAELRHEPPPAVRSQAAHSSTWVDLMCARAGSTPWRNRQPPGRDRPAHPRWLPGLRCAIERPGLTAGRLITAATLRRALEQHPGHRPGPSCRPPH